MPEETDSSVSALNYQSLKDLEKKDFREDVGARSWATWGAQEKLGLAGSQKEGRPASHGDSQSQGDRHEEENGAAPGRPRNRRDSRQFWMEDSAAKACCNCDTPFSFLTRKHHCRACGFIFCANCTSKRIDGTDFGHASQVRVCDECFRNVNEAKRRRAREKREQAEHRDSNDGPIPEDDQIDADMEEEESTFENGEDMRFPRRSSSSLSSIAIPPPPANKFQALKGGVSRASSKRLLEPMDLVDLLNMDDENVDFAAQQPLEKRLGKRAVTAASTMSFRDRFKRRSSTDNSKAGEDDENDFSRSGRKSRSKSVRFSKDGAHIDVMEPFRKEYEALDKMNKGGKIIATKFQVDLLTRRLEGAVLRLVEREMGMLRDKRPSIILTEEVQKEWVRIQNNITKQFCSSVRPYNMDFDGYCKLVSVPGGPISESKLLDGVICENNVVNRSMRTTIEKPRILLLEGAIEFSRERNRISSLDALREQEEQYVNAVVRKLLALRVDVLMVGSSVSRIAQHLLLDADVSLVINVPLRTLERVARMTGASLLPNADLMSVLPNEEVVGVKESDPRGTCELWTIRTFSTKLTNAQKSEQFEQVGATNAKNRERKTLMYFEGCPMKLGASICLRGASPTTLRQITRILTQMITTTYTLKQQNRLFRDIGAIFGEERLIQPSMQKFEDNMLAAMEMRVAKVTIASEDAMHNSEVKNLRFGTIGTDLTLGDFLRIRCFKPSYKNVKKAEAPATSGFSAAAAASGPGAAAMAAVSGTTSKKTSFDENFHRSPSQNESEVFQKGEGSAGASSPAPRSGATGADSEITPESQEEQNRHHPDLRDMDQHQGNSVYCINDKRIYVFNGSLSRDNPTQAKLRGMIENLRREYVAAGIRRLQNSDANRRSRALPIKKLPILTWSECLYCDATTEYRVLSKDAESLSFARWLQLKFYFKARNIASLVDDSESVCKHSIFQDYVTYFELQGQVAGFELERVTPFRVGISPEQTINPQPLPSCAVKWRTDMVNSRKEYLSKTIKTMRTQFLDEKLCKFQSDNVEQATAMDIEALRDKIDQGLAYQRALLEEQLGLLELHRMRRSLISLARNWNDELVLLRERLAKRITMTIKAQSHFGDLNSPSPTSSWRDRTSSRPVSHPPNLMDLFVRPSESEANANKFTDTALENDVEGTFASVSRTTSEPPILGDTMGDENVLPESRGDLLVVSRTKSLPSEIMGGTGSEVLFKTAEDSNICNTLPTSYQEDISKSEPESRNTSPKNVESAMEILGEIGEQHKLLAPVRLSLEFMLRGRPGLNPGFADRVVLVYDEEPTSWIAHALNSKEHRQRIFAIAEQRHLRDELDEGEWCKILIAKLEDPPRHNALDLDFHDSHRQERLDLRFNVKIYCPLHFYALRQAMFNFVEENEILLDPEVSFLESISRCHRWNATGGKSKSLFFKTKDARFILKSITSEELDMFMTIAPKYFEHLANVKRHGLPTSMLKIVGVYSVVVKDTPPQPPKQLTRAYSSTNALSFEANKSQVEAEENVLPRDFGKEAAMRIVRGPPASPLSETDGFVENTGELDAFLDESANSTIEPPSRNDTPDPHLVSDNEEDLYAPPRLTPSVVHGVAGTQETKTSNSNTLRRPASNIGNRRASNTQLPKAQVANGEKAAQLDGHGVASPSSSSSNVVTKMHYIVLENLFMPGEQIDAKFDLKGNLRNRLVSAPKAGQVLLDRNYRLFTNGVPLPMEMPSKVNLLQALESDTGFLESSSVVDYSLLVGICASEDDPHIKAGLIDFLQLYNYKKMLESNVKKAGMIAGQLEPTVIDPSRYRARLMKAMNRYFLGVPPDPEY